MTAASLIRHGARTDGLRPIDSRRDMAALADLMEAGFGGALDPEGRRLIAEMRSFGRAGWLGWMAGRFFLPPAAYPLGYVWSEADRLVGNASILPVDLRGTRWVVANVAVLPEFRRRGIARSMVVACLDLARRRRASEVMLQVEPENSAAVRLYEQLGFVTVRVRTQFRRPAGPPPRISPDDARPRTAAEWREHYRLAATAYPEGLLWPVPLQARLFRPELLPGLLGLAGQRHWVSVEAGRIRAGLTARADWDPTFWRLIVVTSPEARGRVESGLIAAALQGLEADHGAVLDYPAGGADEMLRALGFLPERTLAWMRLELGAVREAQARDSAPSPET